MPQTTQTPHPTIKDLILTFTEEDHSYVDNNDRIYTSVSTIIHEQFEPFNEQANAERMARRLGKTPEQIIAEWHAKRDAACAYGTKIHEHGEFILSHGASGVKHTSDCDKEIVALKCMETACERLEDQFELIACEQKVFSPKYLVAGTADILMRHKRTRVAHVLDFKTNEKITDVFYHRGKGICQHLTDCNQTHYQLQMSIYETLMRSEGIFDPDEPVNRAIIHIPPFSTAPKWIPLPYLDHAVAILAARLLHNA